MKSFYWINVLMTSDAFDHRIDVLLLGHLVKFLVAFKLLRRKAS